MGELRSVIPSRVNILALTATATMETLRAVENRLNLQNPVVVALPPDRRNIFFTVSKQPDIEVFVNELASGIKEQKVQFPKTVIFCSSYMDCAEIYRHLQHMLGPDLTEPQSYPCLQQFRLVDMYTRASTAEMKEKIIESFCCSDSKLRVIIATTAFGLGIDCPDIRKVIHWGPPSDVDQYAQEAGRAGRDGLPAEAVLLYTKKRHIKEKMQEYGVNIDTCRRKLLFKDFVMGQAAADSADSTKCSCCDICKPLCSCSVCSTN